MSLAATLQFDQVTEGNNTITSREYKVVTCRYHFSRHHNYYVPDTNASCDKVELAILAPSGTDLRLYEWYIKQLSFKGSIIFKLRTQWDTVDKVLTFENAKCFSLSEIYDINDNSRRMLKLEFMANLIYVDGIEFKNY